MRAQSAGTLLMGVAVGIGLTTALWMIAAGSRVDEQGTSTTTFEDWAGWGGLLFAVLLFASATVLHERTQTPR